MSQMQEHGASHGSVTGYVLGFFLSVVLTVTAYAIVAHSSLPTSVMVWEVVGLGLVQLFVQLVFFLHLDRESSPRWNLIVFVFAAVTVIILVAGSIWIMQNLDYHMSPAEVEQEILQNEGIPR